MSLWIIHRLRCAVHRNCGGRIHAAFTCIAPLFCVGEGSSKEERYEAKEAEENEEVNPG